MKTVSLLARLSLLLIAGCTAISSRPAKDRPPNIVILYADDMGYGDLAVQNPKSRIPTPNLDRLASEGMRFMDGHSSSGICTPSRYALLTGRYHWRKLHGIVNPFEPPVIDAETLTLPEMLRSRGYRTACIGKWHLGWDWDAIRRQPVDPNRKVSKIDEYDWSRPIPGGPTSHGFDYYFGDDVPNFPPYTWFENDRVLNTPTLPFKADPAVEETEGECRRGPMAPGWRLDAVMPRLTERVVDWIGEQKGNDQPFFLFFAWTSPHVPIVPTAEFQGKSQAGPYGDYVVQSDWSAGQVLKALDANGFRDNTIVIFTSDNGPEYQAYDRIKNTGHRSMGVLRGVKRDIWEGGHRVPFVVRWPGRIASSQVSHALVSQIDLMATLAEIAGAALPATAAEDSFNLLPLWRGEAGAESIRTSLVHNTLPGHYAIREGDWVLIDAPSGQITKVPEWFDQENGYEINPHKAGLYRLSDDLAEHRNLIMEHPEKAESMRALLHRIQNEGHSAPRQADSMDRAKD